MSGQYEFAIHYAYPTFLLGSLFFGAVTLIAALYTVSTIRKRNLWRFLEFAGFLALFLVLTAFWSLNFSNIWHLFFSSRLSSVDGEFQIKLEQYLGPLALETVLFGAFCTLFALSAVVLIKRKLLNSRPHQFMLVVVTVMYIMSLVHWLFEAISVPLNFDPETSSNLDPEVTPLSLLTVNIILSDAIVLWRAWVIWRKANWVFALSAALLIANFIVSVINIIQINSNQHPLALSDTDLFGQPSFSATASGSAALCISFVSNLFATLLVGYRAWIYRREMKEAPINTPLTAKVVSLLVESGMLYCVIWLLYILSNMTAAFGSPVYDAGDTSAPGVQWFNHLMPQLTGIYPTIIIVLVSIEETYADRLRSRSQPSTMFPLAALAAPPRYETRNDVEILIGLEASTDQREGDPPGSPKVTSPEES